MTSNMHKIKMQQTAHSRSVHRSRVVRGSVRMNDVGVRRMYVYVERSVLLLGRSEY